ncbi:Hypothetical predicted protein [Paramuricea clavata]|uniref:Uncharacterized protein n=1 Tax=Paramuricea clavata TaxID=317549 RepID=A0A6S7HCW4_PARCT|nr:Hypothetical predicted protein [Paramuricea clavata]
MKVLLNGEDTVAIRLDTASYKHYLDEIEHNWHDDLHMGCCVVQKDDGTQGPTAMAITSSSVYRGDVERLTELNWCRTKNHREMEQQWCLDYWHGATAAEQGVVRMVVEMVVEMEMVVQMVEDRRTT